MPGRPYRIVAEWREGAWHPSDSPDNPDLPNYVIVCDYGDWSGFRTYWACIKQAMSGNSNVSYWIEER